MQHTLWRRLGRRLAITTALAGAVLGLLTVLTVAATPAQAGQVGVNLTIHGRGAVGVVEGSLEDDADTYCRTGLVTDQTETLTCPRWRNSEAFEAWVWLRAFPGHLGHAGEWTFDRWEGCDQERRRDGYLECGVHSGAFSSDERHPVAYFVDRVAPDAPTLRVSTQGNAERTVAVGTTSYHRSECWVDGGAPRECGIFVLPEGDHTAHARLIDVNGNVSEVSSTAFSVIDTRIAAGPPALSASAAATFDVASDAATTYQCRLDAEPFAPCGTRFAVAGLADGAHTVEVYGVRGAWRDPIPASWQWTVDATAPTTTARLVEQRGGQVRLAVGSSEAGRTECSLGSGGASAPFATCGGTVSYEALADGDYVFVARSYDEAGNPGQPVEVTFTVDTVAPETVLLRTETAGSLASFEFAAPGATGFECRQTHLGRPGAWTDCTSPLSLAGLAAGEHRLEVRAHDAAGNVEAAPATHTWRVTTSTTPPSGHDTTAPGTSLVGGPREGAFVVGPVAITAASTEAGTFACAVDGRTTSCPGGVVSLRGAAAGLRPGRHTLSVAAIDAAGNRDATPATRSWTVPMGVRSLRATAFRIARDPRAHTGVTAVSTRRGATLSTRVSGARRFALVAAPGAGQGTVAVYLGKRRIAAIPLRSGSGRTTVIALPTQASPFTGVVRLVSTSRKPVRVQGLGAAS